MMTVLPTLIALCMIVTCTLLIAVTVQRALTRTAMLRRDLRAGGPFHTARYSISELAWPIPSPLPNLRKGTDRAPRTVVTVRGPGKPQDCTEAA